ncbi:uncharacterized protein LOC119068256 [Bradysia coprophila]|uniref:uncharacterized protein LOC119068256 n=1 Tax=Bradysia coprophila TaxID=38358 RepID=UPI00187D968A|nr:uncharacterized protein LOC119068256 [Bradysia coprophila]
MDYLKNMKPNMKMPKLQKIKESGNAFINRLSLNIFGMSQKRNNQPGRVTIQSQHISTISSLVDKTKSGTFTYDTKKENYGLYALKCNRNAIKQGLLMNVNSETNFHPASRAANAASSTDVHEVFSPCDNNKDVENNFNSIEQYHEYYKIEFSEERCLETSVIDRNANISNNNTRRIECNSNSSSKRVPPPRPKKKLLSLTTSTVNDNNRKCSTSTKPILNNERLLKNCQKNHLSSACSIEPELSSDNHSRKLSYGENELSTRNADSSEKNDSALYRIVQAESILNNSDRNHGLCHAGQINSKMIAIDQYSSIDSGKSYLV